MIIYKYFFAKVSRQIICLISFTKGMKELLRNEQKVQASVATKDEFYSAAGIIITHFIKQKSCPYEGSFL